MTFRLIFTLLLLGYIGVLPILNESLSTRPVYIKAGYIPSGQALKMATGEFRTLVADWTVIRTLFYFGAIFEQDPRRVSTSPEYGRMYNNLVQALKLDPYNQDIYYFSQATFTWNVGKVRETNKLLDYGMKHRLRDWQLPYWAGFNCAYFLKDYNHAARYFKKAAELSGNSLFTKLAARYFHEAGDDELGILFLDAMIKSARDDRVKRMFQVRRDALVAVRLLRKAVETYRVQFNHVPADLESLVRKGVLRQLPEDPYGGDFYLDSEGRVRTTSRLSYAGAGTPENGDVGNSATIGD